MKKEELAELALSLTTEFDIPSEHQAEFVKIHSECFRGVVMMSILQIGGAFDLMRDLITDEARLKDQLLEILEPGKFFDPDFITDISFSVKGRCLKNVRSLDLVMAIHEALEKVLKSTAERSSKPHSQRTRLIKSFKPLAAFLEDHNILNRNRISLLLEEAFEQVKVKIANQQIYKTLF